MRLMPVTTLLYSLISPLFLFDRELESLAYRLVFSAGLFHFPFFLSLFFSGLMGAFLFWVPLSHLKGERRALITTPVSFFFDVSSCLIDGPIFPDTWHEMCYSNFIYFGSAMSTRYEESPYRVILFA